MSEYKTVQGDTFDIIALKIWGDEKKACHLLGANPGIKNLFFLNAGVSIIIPEIETTSMDPVPPWQR